MYLPWLVFVILLPDWSAGAEPKIIFKTTNVECSGNPKRVVNISCIVKAVNWNKAVAQMDCDLVVPMRNFSVQFAVFKKGYNNQYHPFLVNVTFNACDILAKRSFLPYGTLMLKTIKDYSNVNHACPIENHVYAHDLSLDESIFPVPPLGAYMFFLKITDVSSKGLSEHVAVIKFYVQAMEMIRIREKPKLNRTRTTKPSIGQ